MKLVGVLSTAVLSLAMVAAVPAFAQDHEQDDAKAKQDDKQAQPEKPAAKPEERPAAQEERNTKPEEKSAQQEDKAKPEEKNAQQEEKAKPAEKNAQQEQHAAGNGGDRIPANRYKASFGQKHTFRVTQGDYNNHRFAYGGYSFGFVDPWPSNWLYTQNVYVIEINGAYYLCNPSYPGVNLALSLTL